MIDLKKPEKHFHSTSSFMASHIHKEANQQFMPRVLVIDDESLIAEEVATYLRQDGCQVDIVNSAEEALQAFGHTTYHLVLLDVFLPGQSAMEFARLVQEDCFGCAIMLLIGPPPVAVPADAMKLNSLPCLSKPISPQILRKRVHDLLERGPRRPINKFFSLERVQGVLWEGMRARSAVMQEIFAKIRAIAKTDSIVLITGESGTGKELIARAIHNQSRRQNGPFIPIRTKALPRDRVSIELFGREEKTAPFDLPQFGGKLVTAAGGTLFLDEIAMLDERTQMKFLRMLEGAPGVLLGQRNLKQLDVRLIAATRYDLLEKAKEKSFPSIILDRLKVLQLTLPPLRERKEDILPIAYEFLSAFSVAYRKLVGIIPNETKQLLEEYSWPGNISELRDVIEQALLLARGHILDPELLPYQIYQAASGGKVITMPLGCTLQQAEKAIILKTLAANEGNKKGTAELLGISRRSLYNKLAEYNQTLASDDD